MVVRANHAVVVCCIRFRFSIVLSYLMRRSLIAWKIAANDNDYHMQSIVKKFVKLWQPLIIQQ